MPRSEPTCPAVLSKQTILAIMCASVFVVHHTRHKQYVQMNDQKGISCSSDRKQSVMGWQMALPSFAFHACCTCRARALCFAGSAASWVSRLEACETKPCSSASSALCVACSCCLVSCRCNRTLWRSRFQPQPKPKICAYGLAVLVQQVT